MVFLERGLGHGKFFPAQPAGGIAYLKGLAGPIPDFRFVPPGASASLVPRTFSSAQRRLRRRFSWITPKDAVAAGDWARIETLAREAAKLRTT
jgi:2-dehydro-3-deoxyphosphogluconate aldolase / (4S)-4-hydroxy-2-oxoglutarate aldolase